MIGDCRESLRSLEASSIQTCVTSPPYFGLRDYGQDGQLGLETTPDAFVAVMVEVFRDVHRVLADDGTLWLNLGDSYGSGKQLLGIPWRVAFALQADGWYLRQDIIWHKPNPMPESVRDRCTKAHEYIFLLSKSDRYFFDSDAMREPCSKDMQRRAAKGHTRGAGGKIDASRQDADTLRGEHAKVIDVSRGRNRRSVWTVTTKPYKGAHFATFPPDLIEPCVLAGSRPGDTVLDPFGGSGTTAGVALKHGRKAVLCELNPEYAALVPDRIASIAGEGWDLI
jgi:DNA modification methylase